MHTSNINKSRSILSKIRKFKNNGSILVYLRKIDAYVMEELVLTSLEDQGHHITRSERYSGDSGIDGRAVIYGKPYFIQTKRYSSHISKQHVNNFISICDANGVRGLFVHTGKTGRHTRSRALHSSHVHIISGDRLVRLIKGKGFGVSRTLPYMLSVVLNKMLGGNK